MLDSAPVEEPSEDTRNPLAVTIFGLALLGSLVLVAWMFSTYLTDFILAAMFTALLGPLHAWLVPRVRGRPAVAAAVLSAGLVIVLAIPISFLVTSLSVEAASAYQTTRGSVTDENLREFLFGEGRFATYAKRAAEALRIDYTPESVTELIRTAVGTVVGFLYTKVNQLLGDLIGFLFHFLMMILFVFYLLLDGARLKEFLFRLSPLPEVEEELLATKFFEVGRAILFGNGIGSAIQGFLGGIAMSVVGLPSPVLWGTIMTMFAFLPLVGISLVSVPATIYLLLSERVGAAIGFFVFCTAMGLFVENVIKTRLIGQHMRMHNLLIFMSLLAGIAAFGVIGILYGPLVVTAFLTLAELYEQHYRPRILELTRPRTR